MRILALLLFASNLSAQHFQDFSQNLPSETSSSWTMDVEVADLDQDGDLDIITAMEFRENLILWNDGSGQFSVDQNRRLPKADTNSPQAGQDSEDIAVADFDNDGDLDLLFVSEDSQLHELLSNDGTGKFTFVNFQFPTSTANALVVGDINGDSLPDVIIGNNGQDQLYINLGSFQFADSSASHWPVNTDQTQDLKWFDVNQDGHMDLVEGCEVGGNNIFINDGSGHFTEDTTRFPSAPKQETRKIVVGDVTGNGFPDLYFCNVGWESGVNPSDRLFHCDTTGHYTDQTWFGIPFGSDFTLDGIFMDLNADGDSDLVYVGLPNLKLKAICNQGYGTFMDSSLHYLPQSISATAISMASGDFNQDGFADLYIGTHQQDDILLFGGMGPNSIAGDLPSDLFIWIEENKIAAKSETDFITHIRVYDLQGKLHFKTPVARGKKEVKLSMSVPNGVYVAIVEAGGKVYRRKVIFR